MKIAATCLTLTFLAFLPGCQKDYSGSVMDVTLGSLKFQLRIAAEVDHSVSAGGVKVKVPHKGEIIKLAGAEEFGCLARIKDQELNVLDGRLSIGEKSYGDVAEGDLVEITPDGVFVAKSLRGPLPL